MSSENNIQKILRKWYKAKKKIKKLESAIEEYKSLISNTLDELGTNSLSEGGYKVQKRKNSRRYISRETVPVDIWEKYAQKTVFDAYFLSLEKNDK